MIIYASALKQQVYITISESSSLWVKFKRAPGSLNCIMPGQVTLSHIFNSWKPK
jgi:hypothetical protein